MIVCMICMIVCLCGSVSVKTGEADKTLLIQIKLVVTLISN